MADSVIVVPPDSNGKSLDTSQLTVGLNTVQRERMNISDPTLDVGLAKVTNTTAGASDYGLVVRVAGAVGSSPTLYTELTQVTKASIKVTAGVVKSIYISNANAALRYFQLHNKATAPVATDVPLISVPIGAGTATNPSAMELGTDFFSDAGISFSTGIGWAISTTYATFTDSATASEHVALVNYT